eukprot:3852723-Prymnesium_polylepis.1
MAEATVVELTQELGGKCFHCIGTDASSPLHSDRLASRRWFSPFAGFPSKASVAARVRVLVPS